MQTSVDRYPYDALIALWSAVLRQAISDASLTRFYSPEDKEAHLDALEWFGGAEYRWVCQQIGRDPDVLLPKIWRHLLEKRDCNKTRNVRSKKGRENQARRVRDRERHQDDATEN